MKISFKITITQNYLLRCLINDKQNKETIIQLPNNQQDEYIPSITFHTNTNQFIKQWLTRSEEYKIYEIIFQGKRYEIVAEVFFAIIILEFKRVIESDYIIEIILIQLPTENKKAIQRVTIALQVLNLTGIIIDEDEEITYDYSEQGNQLEDILERIEKEIRLLQRSGQTNPSLQNKIKQIDFNKEEMYREEVMNLKLSKTFTTKQRSNMSKLDNYCVFIASRYFNSLQDHINLLFVSKRFRCNMEKFHYNPISVDEETVKIFPNIQTLNIYNDNDKYFKGVRIRKYCDWRKYSYHKTLKIKEKRKYK